jgi:hypothetical protein
VEHGSGRGRLCRRGSGGGVKAASVTRGAGDVVQCGHSFFSADTDWARPHHPTYLKLLVPPILICTVTTFAGYIRHLGALPSRGEQIGLVRLTGDARHSCTSTACFCCVFTHPVGHAGMLNRINASERGHFVLRLTGSRLLLVRKAVVSTTPQHYKVPSAMQKCIICPKALVLLPSLPASMRFADTASHQIQALGMNRVENADRRSLHGAIRQCAKTDC